MVHMPPPIDFLEHEWFCLDCKQTGFEITNMEHLLQML